MIRLLLLVLVLWTVPHLAHADLAPIIVNVTSGNGSFNTTSQFSHFGVSGPGGGLILGDFGFVSPLGGTSFIGVGCGSYFSSPAAPQFPGYNDFPCSLRGDSIFSGSGTLTIASAPTHLIDNEGRSVREADLGTYVLPVALDFTARACGIYPNCDPNPQPVEFIGSGLWTVEVRPFGSWRTLDLTFTNPVPEPATWVLLLTGIGLLTARSLASSRSRV